MKKLAAIALVATFILGACTSEADTVSHNLSKEADSFNVERRVVFFNGITDKYLLTIEGRCSLGNNDSSDTLTVTCRTGPDEYKKHFLGLSDNVSYFVEQTDAKNVDPFHYIVLFRPESILVDVDLQMSNEEREE